MPDVLGFLAGQLKGEGAPVPAFERVRPKDLDGVPAAVEDAYRLALGRRPSDTERERLVRFIRAQAAAAPGPKGLDNALADACQVLLCLNEFVYVD